MLWFIRNSYFYVAPRGFVQHVRFLWALPWVYAHFRRSQTR
jgi:hypothetical protein